MKLTFAIAATAFVNGVGAELEASSTECEATPGVPVRECLRQHAPSSSPLLLQMAKLYQKTPLTGVVGRKGVRVGMRSNAKERRGYFSRDESGSGRRRSCGSTTCEAEQGRWPFVAKIFTFGSPGICMDFSTYQLENQTSSKTGGGGVFSGMRVIAFAPAGGHDMVASSVSLVVYTNYHSRAPVLSIRASSMVSDDDGPFRFRGSLEYFWPDGTDLARFPTGVRHACGMAAGQDFGDSERCHKGLYDIDYANSTLDTDQSLAVPPDLREDIERASIYQRMAWGTFAQSGPLTSVDPGFDYRLVGRSVLDYRCQCSDRCADIVLLYQHPDDLSCVLVFDLNDWLYNAAVGRTFWCGFRDLHWGLVKEFRDTLRSNAFQENIKAKLPSCSFVHTVGHSKGGAQAQLFAACASRYASCDNTKWWNRRRRHCNTDHSLVTWDWVAPEAMEEVEM